VEGTPGALRGMEASTGNVTLSPLLTVIALLGAERTTRGDACAVLEVGVYPRVSSAGLPDNSISAIEVGSNVRAVLYEHLNLQGRQAHFAGGFYYDRLGNVNDRTSSIEIFPRRGGPAATWYLRNDYPSDSTNFWSEIAQGGIHGDHRAAAAVRGRVRRAHCGRRAQCPLPLDSGDLEKRRVQPLW
jgi:hypothetical protein